jgi:hypothetical protein
MHLPTQQQCFAAFDIEFMNGNSRNDGQAIEPESDQESGSDEGEGEEDEEEEDEEEDEGPADLVFPAIYSLAVVQLLSTESVAVNVYDIKLDGDETKLDLAVEGRHCSCLATA